VEGTSGAAYLALLRGRAGEAALGGIGLPELESPPSAATVPRREVWRGISRSAARARGSKGCRSRRAALAPRPEGRGEGDLDDGRRPGAAWAPVFDETASGPGPVTRGDGDAAAAGSAEGARGRQRSCRKPVRGREHRRREVWRRGAVDRGPPRTAPSYVRDRTPRGTARWLRQGPKLEHRRQAKLHLCGLTLPPCGTPESVPRLEPNRESSDLQGARDGSRLQKSVRRIFLVGSRGSSKRPEGL